ncbi:hypothetical protein GCM10010365_09160 [Streptomyces poonensis]|uniref:Uncharacterized protein n=1 Tax=Streptomyces poonensis TaxID=68255 RepID=A0A918UDM0_9ACTN|nr:hypothetical protein GCM10010365_09160 [Streptomyces poonensis]GLJ87644.1 hypothetical protein GCM10017589_02440 [Streptomyces poonensis]
MDAPDSAPDSARACARADTPVRTRAHSAHSIRFTHFAPLAHFALF